MPINLSPNTSYYKVLKPIYKALRFSVLTSWIFTYVIGSLQTKVNLYRNGRKLERNLDLGFDWRHPVPGFETLSIFQTPNCDYVMDASKRMAFDNDTFDIVYASHVLEHIPWYQVKSVVCEWVRILKPQGKLEVWVPDGLKICSALVDYEENGVDISSNDGYYECVENKDPRLWANLRIYAHGNGKGDLRDPNWHRTLFTKSLLMDIFREVGLVDVQLLSSKDVRGRDHGWINLGVSGKKR